jgi:hypothetical protein
MPYISKDKRHVLDGAIEELHHKLAELQLDYAEENNHEGNLNYIISRLMMLSYGDSQCTNYSNINSAIGILECAKLEMYRKVAAPYENQKEFENGKVEGSIKPSVLSEVIIHTEKTIKQ